MDDNNMTTLWISKSTKARLDGLPLGKKKYDEILNILLDVYENIKMDEIIEEKGG